jgi:cation transport protein ChaC
VQSRGPSGENREYLYQLEEALRGLSEESADEHVFDLARRCREIEARGA